MNTTKKIQEVLIVIATVITITITITIATSKVLTFIRDRKTARRLREKFGMEV